LDSISPVGYYFGTNKNNINDYGYWQLWISSWQAKKNVYVLFKNSKFES
jgi:hypothetical protein